MRVPHQGSGSEVPSCLVSVTQRVQASVVPSSGASEGQWPGHWGPTPHLTVTVSRGATIQLDGLHR